MISNENPIEAIISPLSFIIQMKIILLTLIVLLCHYFFIQQYAIQPLTLEVFYKLSSKAVIFDTRLVCDGGLIEKSYWLYGDMKFDTCAPLVADPDDPILLVVDQGRQDQMASKLTQIGYKNILGYNGFPVQKYPSGKFYPKLIKASQSLSINPRTHLDTRTVPEYQAKGIIEGSTLIPIVELPSKLQSLRNSPSIIVNCQSGWRARFAYSLLKNKKIDSIIIDDSFDNFAAEGLKIVPYQG